MPHSVKILAPIAAVAKGALIAGVLAVLDVGFLKSLAIAGLSAFITGLFVLGAAYIGAREVRRNREHIQAVQRKLGAAQRAGDDQHEGG